MSFTSIEQARAFATPNPLKEKLDAGVLAHALSIKIVSSIEVLGFAKSAGYDACLIDLEHSPFGLETTNQLSCAALSLGLTPIVRVPANTSDWISRTLDGGAQAIIVPHVNSAAEAANVVKYARFAPLGERSATGTMPMLRYANVPAKFANPICNDLVTVICMIETERALEDVDSIAAVEGVDVLLIGCGDLTSDMGIPGDMGNPRVEAAFDKVAAAARKVSVNGRKVSVGFGGLHNRLDLVEKFAKKNDNARFVMAGADNTFLLQAIVDGGAAIQKVEASIKNA
ncbi:uncharacterized protein I303_103310 [Kwoniella dejecticola CBS 10117]|uniref:HpcH/HpaI aldolase/citrate lyase domain-containing protein n=1 Tax=Kwoniella dejecticola CBS 10117 TaxID=1296121 RepID=A0A1A6A6D6_9TREE|nr:uncharacterized protein I303_03333 [Kwoniella dejecticola CBS 10117]OBR85622.1 hypothetical protein I303_03333 [Kwoniella dejecticola CBS 10117]